MTLQSTSNDAVLVAIDVTKTRNEIPIEEPGRTRRRRMTVLNAKADHDRFVDALGRYGDPVVAGFEATEERPSTPRTPSA